MPVCSQLTRTSGSCQETIDPRPVRCSSASVEKGEPVSAASSASSASRAPPPDTFCHPVAAARLALCHHLGSTRQATARATDRCPPPCRPRRRQESRVPYRSGGSQSVSYARHLESQTRKPPANPATPFLWRHTVTHTHAPTNPHTHTHTKARATHARLHARLHAVQRRGHAVGVRFVSLSPHPRPPALSRPHSGE